MGGGWGREGGLDAVLKVIPDIIPQRAKAERRRSSSSVLSQNEAKKAKRLQCLSAVLGSHPPPILVCVISFLDSAPDADLASG